MEDNIRVNISGENITISEGDKSLVVRMNDNYKYESETLVNLIREGNRMPEYLQEYLSGLVVLLLDNGIRDIGDIYRDGIVLLNFLTTLNYIKKEWENIKQIRRWKREYEENEKEI